MTDDEVVARLLVLQRQVYDLVQSVNVLIHDLQTDGRLGVDNFNEDGIR